MKKEFSAQVAGSNFPPPTASFYVYLTSWLFIKGATAVRAKMISAATSGGRLRFSSPAVPRK